jgi:hypothetical protein
MGRCERSSIVFETTEVAGRRRAVLWRRTNLGIPTESASRCAPAPVLHIPVLQIPVLQMECRFRGTNPRRASRMGSSAVAVRRSLPRRSCACWQSEAREHHRINGLVLSYLHSGKVSSAEKAAWRSEVRIAPRAASGATHSRPSAAAMRPATVPLARAKRFWQNNFRRKQQWNQRTT